MTARLLFPKKSLKTTQIPAEPEQPGEHFGRQDSFRENAVPAMQQPESRYWPV